MTESLSRRRALSGATVLGVGLPLLAACGEAGDNDGDTAKDGSPTPSSPAPSVTSTSDSATSDSATSDSATSADASAVPGALVATADVPVGGGVVLNKEQIVVTQPSAGEFKAFSAICTHQACLVGSVADGTITCPCHGSTYAADDGSVTGGPAPSPLASVAVKVQGDQVVRG